MTLDDVYQQLAIPDSCLLKQRIYKKQFYNNTPLNKADQQRFSELVDTVEWRYTLKPGTINIPKYVDQHREYLEIALLQVNLKKQPATASQQGKLAEMIQRAIPYPLILVFVWQEHIAIQLAHKRINLADSSKLTLERLFDTGWLNLSQLSPCQHAFLDDFVLLRCSYLDLYHCYQDLVRRVVALNCADFSGHYHLSEGAEGEQQTRLDRLRSHQQQLALLRAELKPGNPV